MVLSYMKATQTIASTTIPAPGSAITVFSTPFTKLYGASEWSVNGSGGLVYSGSTTGKAISFCVDMKYTIGTSNDFNVYILKNTNNYPEVTYLFNGPGGGSNFLGEGAPNTLVCSPGDVFFIGFRKNTGAGGDATNSLVITVNIASAA